MKILTVLSIFLVGCIYSFRGSLPSSLKAIYIEPFGEKLTEGRSFRSEFTEGVNQAFIADNTLQSVSKNQADLVLRGNIESISRKTEQVAISNQPIANTYKLTVSVSIDCQKADDKKSLIKTTITRDSQIDASISEDELEDRIRLLLNEIKNIIVDRVIGAW